jgi:hypothetical protein
LDAQYRPHVAIPSSPAMLETFAINPDLRWRMDGRTAWISFRGAKKLTSIWCRYSSSLFLLVWDDSGGGGDMPHVFDCTKKWVPRVVDEVVDVAVDLEGALDDGAGVGRCDVEGKPHAPQLFNFGNEVGGFGRVTRGGNYAVAGAEGLQGESCAKAGGAAGNKPDGRRWGRHVCWWEFGVLMFCMLELWTGSDAEDLMENRGGEVVFCGLYKPMDRQEWSIVSAPMPCIDYST